MSDNGEYRDDIIEHYVKQELNTPVIKEDDGEYRDEIVEYYLYNELLEDIIQSLKCMFDDAVKYKDMILEYGKIEFASMCDDEDLEEESISGINMPPLDWTDPDVEVND